MPTIDAPPAPSWLLPHETVPAAKGCGWEVHGPKVVLVCMSHGSVSGEAAGADMAHAEGLFSSLASCARSFETHGNCARSP